MLLLPLLAGIGWIELSVPAFFPLGAVLGGYVFGVAMTWASGCAGGIWYKLGGGNWRAAIAIIGLAVGATAAERGLFRGFREVVQDVGRSDRLQSATIGGLIGFEAIVFVIALVLALLLFRSKLTSPAPNAWSWAKTGAAMGVLAVLAWLSSALAGRSFGMAVVPGSVDALSTLVGGEPRLSWDLFFVLFIPVGGYLATRKNAAAASPLGKIDAIKLFFGGIVLGVAASLAAGCTVGHSLVGLPLLSLGSIVTTISIILGTWTVGWFEMRTERRAAASAPQPAVAGSTAGR
jgi:hypothetical protein